MNSHFHHFTCRHFLHQSQSNLGEIVRVRWCSLWIALAILVGTFPIPAAAADNDDRAVENLAQFARLYGYVRFFHPSEEAVAVDWEKFAVLGTGMVRDAGDDAALRQALKQLFEPIVVGLRVVSADDRTTEPNAVPPTGRRMFWQHYGVRLSQQSDIYKSRRVVDGEGTGIRAAIFRPTQPPPIIFQKLIGSDTAIELPLVLFPSSDGRAYVGKHAEFVSLQQRLARLEREAAVTNLITDWRVPVAGVVIAWNVLQHFHPYIDSLGLNWEETLRPTLRRAMASRSRDDYAATLRELVARLQDGHGFVPVTPGGGLPIRVEVIEDQIVVTGVEGDNPFRKGDVIVSIDGVPGLALLREQERYVAGSPQLRQFRALNQFGQGPLNGAARVEIIRDGGREQFDFKRAPDRRGYHFNSIAEFQLPTFAEIRPGIFYVNTSTCDANLLEKRLTELANARGVIFDHRAGSVAARAQPIEEDKHIIPHLIDKTIQASPMRVPQVTQPDRVGWTHSEKTWPVEPKAPRLQGRVVFINVPAVVSYGETCMAMVADYRLAKLVGAPTAGCNGNVNRIILPGFMSMAWTGMEVLKHDHSPFYLTGFVPDHPVARTIKAVKEGRDEYLEKAIEVIEQPADPPKP